MHAAIRPYVTAGVALVGASAIAVTPIAATPRDIKVSNPAVQLTASPFDAYAELVDDSMTNLSGLLSLALAAPPTLPFTVGDFISQALEVDANIAAFRALVSGLSGQIDSLNQLNQLFIQAASNELQAGNVADALDIALYTTLFNASGVLAFALYPAALLGVDVEELTPEISGAALNAVIAPPFSALAVGGRITQDVLEAVRAGADGDIPAELIAAPARLTNGLLNGTDLETSVFGPVAIPGILTSTTLLDAEGPGTISLAIELVQFVRGLATPSAAASAYSETQASARVRVVDLDLNKGSQTDGTPPKSTEGSETRGHGNLLDADKVTNTGAGGSSSGKKGDRVRLFDATPRSSEGRSQSADLKTFGQGVRDGIRGLREGVRDAVKSITGAGSTSAGREASAGSTSEAD